MATIDPQVLEEHFLEVYCFEIKNQIMQCILILIFDHDMAEHLRTNEINNPATCGNAAMNETMP